MYELSTDEEGAARTGGFAPKAANLHAKLSLKTWAWWASAGWFHESGKPYHFENMYLEAGTLILMEL